MGVALACVASTLFFVSALAPGRTPLLLASWGVLGATVNPVTPLSLQHAAELTFPVSPDISSAAVLVAGNLLACVLVLTLPLVINSYLPDVACSTVATPLAGILVALQLVGLFAALMVKQDYRRAAAEKAGETTPLIAPPEEGGDGVGEPADGPKWRVVERRASWKMR